MRRTIYKALKTMLFGSFLFLAACGQENQTGSVTSLAVGNDYAAYIDGMGKLHILYDDVNATEGLDLEKTYQSLGADPLCLVAVDETGKAWVAYPYSAEEVELQLEELYQDAAESGGNVGTSHRNPELMYNFEMLDSVSQIVSQYPYSYFALLKDGTLVNGNGSAYEALQGVEQFARDENNEMIGLKKDGTLVLGINDILRQKKFEEWPDKLQAICAGKFFVGLKKDGTVIVEDVEINHYVSSSEAWVDIMSLAVAGDTVVGLKKDGTVVAVCKTGSDKGQCDVDEWTGIAMVGTNGNVTVGVKNNGDWVSTK